MGLEVNQPYAVTVIIPTLAEAARRGPLLRAIDCVLGQRGARARPLVVINGDRFDASLRSELESRTDLDVHYLAKPSVTEAQAFGVACVRTPFFSFLDDDDLYTDDAIAHRLDLLAAEPQTDFAVTNFYFQRDGVLTLAIEDMTRCAADPLHAIFEFAWMASLNTLFRTGSISSNYFRPKVPQMEWTSLGISIARDKKGVFSNRPTAIYVDSPNSASKRDAHLDSMISLLETVRQDCFPRRTRRVIERKYATALHMLCERALTRQDVGAAWHHHWRCLATPGGLRYLTFTRKLLWRGRG